MTTRSTPRHPIAFIPWLIAATLLLVPLVAMQFTDAVRWDAADFATFGVMAAIACGLYEVARRVVRGSRNRAIAAAVIAGVFLLVWIEL